MEFDTLIQFIKKEYQRLLRLYKCQDGRELKYPMVIKIMEELGELSEEVLASDGFQRGGKLKNHSSAIDEEFADMIIVLLLLAENMQIDVISGLKKKMRKIKQRRY